MPRRRQFADLRGNRNDPTAAARMREKRKAIKLGNELVGRPFTMDEYRAHLAAKGIVPPSSVSHRLDYPDESVTACGLPATEVYLEKKGQEPTCPNCHTPKFILRKLTADKKAKRNDLSRQPEPAVNRRPKFPKRAIDRLFRAGFDGRLTAAVWRSEFAKLEASHGSCKYGKQMFSGGRQRMESTIKHQEQMMSKYQEAL